MGFWMEGMRGWMGRVKAQGTFANVHESLHLGMSLILKDDLNIPRSPGLRGAEFLGLHLKNGRNLMDSNLDCKGLNYMFCKKVLQFCDVTTLVIIYKPTNLAISKIWREKHLNILIYHWLTYMKRLYKSDDSYRYFWNSFHFSTCKKKSLNLQATSMARVDVQNMQICFTLTVHKQCIN